MNEQLPLLMLQAVRREFANQRRLAERAIEQLDDQEFFRALDDEANSVAVIIKHLGGNLRSRWTDFMTSDGEKPDRNRDGEFVAQNQARADIMRTWAAGWAALEETLGGLEPGQLLATVRIRGQAVPVPEAISRSLAHTAQHVGQIILLAKHLRGRDWQTLSIPRGRSGEFLQHPPS